MTAIPIDSTPSHPVPTLLSTLKLYQTSLQSRHSLLKELESALSSFLSTTPTSLETISSSLTEGTTSVCVEESIRPPNENELQEILRIGFEGVLEFKQEHLVIEGSLKDLFGRTDLSNVVKRIEGWEEERLKLMIERDQLRRLRMITDVEDDEFAQSLKDFDTRRQDLAQQIHEEEREIDAEIIDLSAAEE